MAKEKEINKARILADKLTDEEIDIIFDNPGVSRFFRAFVAGKTVQAEISNRSYTAKGWEFFASPQVSKFPWRIIEIVESNGIGE